MLPGKFLSPKISLKVAANTSKEHSSGGQKKEKVKMRVFLKSPTPGLTIFCLGGKAFLEN